MITLLRETNQALLALLASLDAKDWARPTVHADRSVKDLTAHLLDGSLRRLSIQRDGHFLPGPQSNELSEAVSYVQALNREWIGASRRLSPRVLQELLRWADEELVELFSKLDPQGPAPFGVAWAGQEWSSNAFDMAREYTEKWHHQQQLRDAVQRPGLCEARFVRPVLETFLEGAPFAFRDVERPEGAELRLVVEGEGGGRWGVHTRHGRWEVDAAGEGTATATATLSTDTAWRLWTRGLSARSARERVHLEGDLALGEPLLSMTTIMA